MGLDNITADKEQTQMPFLTDDLIRQLPPPAKGNKVTYDQPDPDVPATADVVVTGMGIKITAAGRRTWGLSYRLRDGAGTQRWYTIGRFPYVATAAARKRARKLKEEIELGGDPQGDRAGKRREPTVAQLADQFMLACEQKIRAGKLRQSTVDSYERALRLHIRPQLGTLKISAVTKRTIARFHEQISESGRLVQANRNILILSTMLTWAVSQELLPMNPCTKAVELNPEQPRARDISKEERVRLTEELAKHYTQSATALKLLLMTGARRGEVMGMKWADITFGSDSEPKTLWRRLAPDQKNKKDHTLPLNTGAVHLLVTIRDETLARDGQLGEFVFPSSESKSRHIANIYKTWLIILKNAKIGRDRDTARATLGQGLAVSAFPRYVPV
jgi:integrase